MTLQSSPIAVDGMEVTTLVAARPAKGYTLTHDGAGNECFWWMMDLTFIDHYDSFSFNVIDWLTRAGFAVHRITIDDNSGLLDYLANPTALCLSPGPRRPQDYPHIMDLTRLCLGRVPILGVCLGHQMLGLLAGGLVVRARAPFHGSAVVVKALADGDQPGVPGHALLHGTGPEFRAVVYNSLTVDAADFRAPWKVLARDQHGEVAALGYLPEHGTPAFGLQFHPESFMSERSEQIAANWAGIVRSWSGAVRSRSGTVLTVPASGHRSSATAPLSIPS